MNKPINDELKQLLYNKGWRYDLNESIEDNRGLIVEYSLAEAKWNQGNISYIDNISIVDVIMWLYEKHDIWIYITPPSVTTWYYNIESINKDFNKEVKSGYKSPKEAYEAAIKYCLTELIK